MKKHISIIVIFILLLSISGVTMAASNPISLTNQQKAKSLIDDKLNSKESQEVKSLTIGDNITFKDYFSAGLTYITWGKSVAEDSVTYVTIKGIVEYNGKAIVAAIQYKFISETKANFYAIEYNDIPQNSLEATSFFEYLDTQYSKHQEAKKPKTVTISQKSKILTIKYSLDKNGYISTSSLPDKTTIICKRGDKINLICTSKENSSRIMSTNISSVFGKDGAISYKKSGTDKLQIVPNYGDWDYAYTYYVTIK